MLRELACCVVLLAFTQKEAVLPSSSWAQDEDLVDSMPAPEAESESPTISFEEDEEALPTDLRVKQVEEGTSTPEFDEHDPSEASSISADETSKEHQEEGGTSSTDTAAPFSSFGISGAPTPTSPADAWPTQPLPEPLPLPPFMTRPSEWDETPPAVIGMPTLPPSSAFAERDRAAFKFIEDGKESFDREDWAPAREQFERAVSLAPLLPYSYYFLGRIAFIRGELTQAVAFLQKAELLFSRSDVDWLCEIVTVKGAVYEDLRDYPKARASYNRSLQFQPTNLKVLSALARLPEQEPVPHDAVAQ